MNQRFFKIMLGLIIAGLSWGILSCQRNPKNPGYEVRMFTDMMYPVPYEAYSKNPVFENHVTMQPPIAGTVARGSILEKPLARTPANLDRGKFVYEHYCVICHGKKGDGDGPLIPKYPNPPSFTSRRVKALSAREIFHIVSYGKGDMPSHAGQIGVKDRWKAVYYVQTLQGKKD